MTTKAERKFLLEILKPYKFVIVALIFCSILASAFDSISIGMLVPLLGSLQKLQLDEQTPKFMRWMADFLQAYPLSQQILLAIGLVVLALTLKNITLALSFKSGYWLSSKLTADLKVRAMDLLMEVGIDFHRKSMVGDLMHRAIDAPNQFDNLIKNSVEFIANLLTLIMLVGLLVTLSWQLSLVSLALGISYLYLMTIYMKRLRKVSEEHAQIDLKTKSKVQESLSAIELIKSYSRENFIISTMKDLIERTRIMSYHIAFKNNAVHWITDIMGGFAIAILFIASMFLYDMNTKILIVHLLPFLYIVTRLVPLLKLLNGIRACIITHWPALRFNFELLRTDDKPFLIDGQKPFGVLNREIKFSSVNFSYDQNDTFTLRDINFSLPKGKTTALVGQSGAGKSTIINLIMRFYDPQAGNILIDSEPLKNFQIESYRNKIGIVSQDVFLFHDTAKNNIAFGLQETPSDECIVAAARKGGAHDFILDLPKGYDTVLGERGMRLSSGQRQRISIARAILRDPEILILDEATSALDTNTELLIHKTILELSQNCTVIIIAHRLSTIKNADQIIVFKNGQVVEVGHADHLLKQKGEYYRLAHTGQINE